jgi:guanylate kinase
MSIKQRFILATQEFVSGDKFAKILFALLTGKKVDDVNFLADVIHEAPTKTAGGLLVKLREVVRKNPSEFSDNSTELLDELEQCIKERKLILIISGPSAVGKDQLAVDCIDELENHAISARCLEKRGTRLEKPGEMKRGEKINGTHLDSTAYYSQRTKKKMEKDDDLFFLYPKYQHLYGFSKSDLLEDTDTDVLFVIFGAINRYPAFIKKLKSITTRKILSVLLTAEEHILWRRQENRKIFSSAEMMIRTKEMRRDIKLIEKSKDIVEMYDLVLQNGYRFSISQSEDVIIDTIKEVLGKE